MLTAATAALLSGPVMGQDFTDITTKVTQQIKTSTADNGKPGDILIESAGSVVVTTAGPAVEIDSDNTVTNQGIISNIGTTGAIGVQLDATAAGNGPGSDVVAFDSTGTIDLTGDGTGKTGILVGIANGDSTGIFNGGINLETASQLKIAGDTAIGIHVADNTTMNGELLDDGTITLTGGTGMTGILIGTSDTAIATLVGDLTVGGGITATGDQSIGLHVEPNSVVNGNIEIDGSISVAPTDATSLTGGDDTGVLIEANASGQALTGNFTIGSSGSVTATGAGAQGVVIQGEVGGHITNNSSIDAFGTTSATTNTGNPTGGIALAIADNVDAGILNNGPVSSTDSTLFAKISGNGSVPVVLISPSAAGATPSHDIHILPYMDADANGDYSFINRGAISTVAANIDQIAGTAVRIEGGGAFMTFLDGGFFSSGTLSAAVTGDDKQADPALVTGLSIGANANIPVFFNSNQNTGSVGSVTASYTGTFIGGSAFGIHIEKDGVLSTIVNQGTISASATSTVTDSTIKVLDARAIWDESGSLREIDNSGTISATATTLDDNSQNIAAIDMSVATQDTVIDNSGTITGQILLGTGADSVTVHGDANNPAIITGDIAFGGTSSSANDDKLEIDDFGTVTGKITDRAAGRLDVLINPGGTLTLQNDSIDPNERFNVNTLTVNDGGSLGISLTQAFNLASNPNAGGIVTASGQVTLNPLAKLVLPFQTFLAGQTPGQASQFILIDAPLGELQLDLNALQSDVCPTLPFLFETTAQCLSTANTDTRSDLILNLTPKTAEEIGLTGYAAKMFPVANLALANDDQLGAAVINAGLPVDGAQLTPEQGRTLYQAVYSQFAPNVTGASRALAIELTDQASGPVGARQRALRMYAGQPGDLTLWGQEFNFSLNQDADAGTIGYRDSGFGLVVGVDGGDPADGRYGGALTFYSGNINEKQPQQSKTSSNWATLTAYTDWRGKGLFLDTQISAGVGQLDGKRTISVGGVTRTADGKRDTLLGSIGMTTGVILTTGSTVITPQISLDGLAMKENGYTEHGGGDPTGGDAFDLNVSSAYYQSARGFVGADLRQDLNLGDFYLQPQARAGYRYDFLADAPKLKASFAGTPGTDFTLTGPDPDKGNVVLGGSLATTTGAWSIGVNYDYLRGNNGSVSQVGTLTLVGRI